MGVDWRMGVSQTNPANALMQGFEYGQGQRKELNTRNALSAYAADPSDANGNALMVEGGPQLAGQAQAYTGQRAENHRANDYRTALDAYTKAPLGSPESEAAYAQMVATDAPAAQTFRHNQFGEIQNKAKMADQGFDYVAERLGNVTDEASYQRVLGEAEQIFGPMGIDVRKMAPPNYPGPEGVQQLLRSAMSAKEQLSTSTQELRLKWNIQDDQADNARADANLESNVRYREGRLDVARHPPVRPRAPSAPRAAPAPTPTRIRGQILEKYRRDPNSLTPSEQAIMDGSAEGRGSRGGRRGGGGLPAFQTPEQVDAAKRGGRVKSGDKFRLPNGDIGTVP